MGDIWSGVSDGSGSVTIYSAINVDSVSRTNNTITINNLYVRNWTPTGGAFDAPPWYDDVYSNGGGTGFITGWQSKGNTGSGVITNNNYYTSGTSPSVGVSSGDTVYYFQHRINTDGVWRGWIGPIGVGIPATTSPTISGGTVTGITTNSANLAWTATTGNYCTYDHTLVEWGLTLGYGSSTTAGQNDNRTLSSLQPGKTYYYRLTAYNAIGYTGQSTGQFTTLAVPGIIPILIGLM
jgi:hypothetical protein